ncbi:MAG TPA: DNA primase, partial [Candidatus Latescibacteria bacterium]|nr:DNA primase [Candidatus Latescibacterota bacterium]
CPFHTERTPSLSVNPELGIFHCFGCGVGGDVFGFLMKIEGISFYEALRRLADRYGIPLPKAPQEEGTEALYQANAFAEEFYRKLLWENPAGDRARKYLEERGIGRGVAERFGLGYAPPGWEGLVRAASSRGIRPEVLERAGLALRRRSGGYYDRFRDRLTFPIHNPAGRPVAFGARVLGEGEPKYLNSPETPIYHKGRVLYGIAQAREAVRREGEVVVVEGYMDLLRLFSARIENAVAVAGTAFTPHQAQLLRRYAERVVLCFDADRAGSEAALRGGGVLLEAGLEVRIVELPPGHDPDSFVRDEGREEFLRRVCEARPMVEHLLERARKAEDLSSVEGRRRAAKTLAGLLARIGDELGRDLWIGRASEALGVREEVLRVVVAEGRREMRRPVEPGPIRASLREVGSPAQRDLLKILFSLPELASRIVEEVELERFEGALRPVAEVAYDAVREGRNPTVSDVLAKTGNEGLAEELTALLQEGFDREQTHKILADAIASVRREGVRKEIERTARELKEAERSGDRERVDALYSHLMYLKREEARLIRARRPFG